MSKLFTASMENPIQPFLCKSYSKQLTSVMSQDGGWQIDVAKNILLNVSRKEV